MSGFVSLQNVLDRQGFAQTPLGELTGTVAALPRSPS